VLSSTRFGGTHFFNTRLTQQFRDPAWLNNKQAELLPRSPKRVELHTIKLLDLGPGTAPVDVDLQWAARDQADRIGIDVDTVYTYHDKSLPHEATLPRKAVLGLAQLEPEWVQRYRETNVTFLEKWTLDAGNRGYALIRDESTDTRMNLQELFTRVQQLAAGPWPPYLFWRGFSQPLVAELVKRSGTPHPVRRCPTRPTVTLP
jgi:hypothetical protein